MKKDKLQEKMDNELKNCTPEQRKEIIERCEFARQTAIEASKLADEETMRRKKESPNDN
jgi:hypothetical protein